MKKNWEMKKLGEVCTFINGRAYKKEELLNDGKYPVLRVGNFFTNNNWYYSDLELPEDKYCDNGDLLYAWSASFGPRIWSGNKVIFHYHIWKIIQDESQILKEFLYLFLLWDTERLKKHGNGTTMVHVTKGNIENTSIHLPPLPEQQRIVSILDETFAAIDKAKENAEKNLQKTQELYESYLRKVFANSGDQWEEKKLGNITVVQSGGTPLKYKKEYWDGDISWYSSGELNDLYTNPPKRNITGAGLDNSNAKIFPKGSLLIGMYDTAALKMSILDRDAAFNQAIAGAKPNDEIDLIFAMHAINTIKPEILNERRGVRQKNLSLEKIKNISISLPILSEQKLIVENLISINEEINRLKFVYQQKLAALDELKKSVLQKAFNGELAGA